MPRILRTEELSDPQLWEILVINMNFSAVLDHRLSDPQNYEDQSHVF